MGFRVSAVLIVFRVQGREHVRTSARCSLQPTGLAGWLRMRLAEAEAGAEPGLRLG